MYILQDTTSDGKRPCFKQPICSSLLPLQNICDPKTGELVNYTVLGFLAEPLKQLAETLETSEDYNVFEDLREFQDWVC